MLTPQGVEAKTRLTVRFLKRKIAEYERLQAEIAALEEEVRGRGKDAGREERDTDAK